MSVEPLRIALIGCGRIAGHHCRAIAEVNGIALAAVCDLEVAKADAYAREFGVPAYASYRDMFVALPEIDVAAVITPSGMHFEHGMEMLTEYGKHVIMEKPAFMRPAQLVDAYEAAAKAKRKVFPVFQNRHNKAVCWVKKALASGELGDVRVVAVRVRWCRPQRYYDMAPWRGTFSHDGGALTNQSIHHIDLIRHLGGEVAGVSAVMRTLGADVEVEDTCVASLAFNSGAVGVVEATTAARPDDFGASISIVGSKGLAEIAGIAVNELTTFTPEPAACAENTENFQVINGAGAVYGFGHRQIYCDVVADLSGGATYPVTRDDCLATLRLLHAFYRADEAGGWVAVDSDEESSRLGRSDESISALYRTPRQ